MTVLDFFSANYNPGYYTVNIVNINTNEEIVTNTAEIGVGSLNPRWCFSEIWTWRICDDTIYLGVAREDD